MNKKITHPFTTIALGVILAIGGEMSGGLRAEAQASSGSGQETVLFPFDDYSLPLNKGLVLSLLPGRKSKITDPAHPNKPVLTIGESGDPDYPRLSFYGTVLKIGEEYRMWYSGTDNRGERQICYAVSKDGIEWVKPKLGLALYNRNRNNNLVLMDEHETMKGLCALVLYEPEDPNPAWRYKMLREIAIPGLSWPVYAAVSPDGLHWHGVAGNKPINSTQIEPTGFIKFHGVYYVNGHSTAIRHPIPGAHKRTMQTFMSYDFEHWTQAAHMSFRRDNIPPRPPTDFEGSRGEQVHVGASLWTRGNVILGFYGQYHNATNDRRTSIIDLGFIVSNDGLHFTEPLPDFKMIPSAEETDRAEPRLIQGQGFINIGDRTFVYYGVWTMADPKGPTGVRVATWQRDRLGYFTPSVGVDNVHCISCPIRLQNSDAHVYINASGLSSDTQLKVAILDEQFRPISGYTAADCTPLEQSGFRLPVSWHGQNSLGKIEQPIRVRINWVGREADKAKLFAAYVD